MERPVLVLRGVAGPVLELALGWEFAVLELTVLELGRVAGPLVERTLLERLDWTAARRSLELTVLELPVVELPAPGATACGSARSWSSTVLELPVVEHDGLSCHRRGWRTHPPTESRDASTQHRRDVGQEVRPLHRRSSGIAGRRMASWRSHWVSVCRPASTYPSRSTRSAFLLFVVLTLRRPTHLRQESATGATYEELAFFEVVIAAGHAAHQRQCRCWRRPRRIAASRGASIRREPLKLVYNVGNYATSTSVMIVTYYYLAPGGAEPRRSREHRGRHARRLHWRSRPSTCGF